jgi:hypothetical protein
MTPAFTTLTPVAVQFIPEPLITWMDLREVPFTDPFFRDTVAKASSTRAIALSGLEELRAQDRAPSLPPALFVFHASRCGSTLLSQMLATVASNVVVSEPATVNGILSALRPAAEQAELLRLMLRALGRNRGGASRRLVVKFSSWNVLAAEAIHRLFPETPLVWVQRAPLAVVASQAERPAGWCAWQGAGDPAVRLFGLTIDQARALSPGEFRLRAIEALYRAVHEARLPFHVVDHAQLPGALWTRVARHAGLSFSDDEVAGMQARARFDAKTGDRPFVPRQRASALSAGQRRYVAEHIEPLYRALAGQESQPQQLP